MPEHTHQNLPRDLTHSYVSPRRHQWNNNQTYLKDIYSYLCTITEGTSNSRSVSHSPAVKYASLLTFPFFFFFFFRKINNDPRPARHQLTNNIKLSQWSRKQTITSASEKSQSCAVRITSGACRLPHQKCGFCKHQQISTLVSSERAHELT